MSARQDETRRAGPTPGPWVNDPSVWGDIDGPGGVNIAFIIDETDKDTVVEMLTSDGACGPPVEQAKANARLIAAAPEMLAALRRARNFIENTESELGIVLDSGNAVRAAIAKATSA